MWHVTLIFIGPSMQVQQNQSMAESLMECSVRRAGAAADRGGDSRGRVRGKGEGLRGDARQPRHAY